MFKDNVRDCYFFFFLKKPQILFYTVPLFANVDFYSIWLRTIGNPAFRNHVSSEKNDFAKFLTE